MAASRKLAVWQATRHAKRGSQKSARTVSRTIPHRVAVGNAARPSGWFILAGWVFVVFAVMVSGPVWPGAGLLGCGDALAQGLGSSSQANDLYTAHDVPIGAEAENAAVARDRAIASGQVKALQTVLERIADPAQVSRLPQVTREQVLPLVETYSLADERTSATMYKARLTVQFSGPAVRRLLDQRGIGHAVEASRPVLVIPVYQAGPDQPPILWEDTNPWLAAWRRHRNTSVLLPVEVPTGDLTDLTTVSPEQALEPDGTALAKLLSRYGRDTVLLAHAVRSGPDTLDVSLSYGSPRAMARTGRETVHRQDGEDDRAFLTRAADDVAHRLESDWRDANMVQAGTGHQVTALVTLGGFNDWMVIRRGLARTPLVRQVTLQAITKTMAQLTLSVQGDSDRVGQALALEGLSLTVHGNYWMITRAGASAPPLGAEPAAASPSSPSMGGRDPSRDPTGMGAAPSGYGVSGSAGAAAAGATGRYGATDAWPSVRP